MEESYDDPSLILESSDIEAGSVSWRSPSNIALIKYWGKSGRQIPANPSLSFTLEKAYTETTLSWNGRTSTDKGPIELKFSFEGEQDHPFGGRLERFLESVLNIFPFLRQLELQIESENSFPHSSGIASSASSMSAVALCLCSMEDILLDSLGDDEEYRRKASFSARLASGSACRSIYGTAALWGRTGEIAHSSDEYAIPFEAEIHDNLRTVRDSILIVDSSEKTVPSRSGHSIMDTHPYADARYKQARRRLHDLIGHLNQGNWTDAGQIIEDEAFTLHALMMSHRPSYTLLAPDTVQIIQSVRLFRERTDIPVYFTLDAGPNVHLLYPEKFLEEVQSFIGERLLDFCEDRRWIDDKMGDGPLEL